MITIQSQQTIFDLGILLEGKLDNIVQDIMIKYNLTDLMSDYTGTKIDATFNTTNNNVRFLYNNNINVETFDSQLYQTFLAGGLGPFDIGYDENFDV